MYDNFFLHFFEILSFKEICETFCTEFVNYLLKFWQCSYLRKILEKL